MRLFCLLMFVFFTNICMADGAYFSRAVERDHSIPYQRAIVRFKDNRETLIVESFNQGAQGDYIWVVPVPEKPRKIEAVSPGTIETLVAVMGPEIVSLPTSEAAALCFGLLAFTAYLFAFPVGKKGVGTKKLRTVLFEGFALLSVVTICCAILTPVFASPTSQSVDVPGGMTVERVGDMWVVKAFDKFGDPAIKTVKVTKKEAGHKSRQPEMIAALDRPWIPLQPSIVRFRTLVWRLQRHQ